MWQPEPGLGSAVGSETRTSDTATDWNGEFQNYGAIVNSFTPPRRLLTNVV